MPARLAAQVIGASRPTELTIPVVVRKYLRRTVLSRIDFVTHAPASARDAIRRVLPWPAPSENRRVDAATSTGAHKLASSEAQIEFFADHNLFLRLRQFFLRGKKLATANASTVIPNTHVKV
jgi:hypothetical protein